MCRAFDEMVQDGVRKGEKRILKLIEHMSAHGDAELIPRLSKEPELVKKMYQKYRI